MSCSTFHVILYQPEIPPNTGNIIRLCANTGAHLHLIEPLGFSMSDKHLKRAGLDYHANALLTIHPNLAHAFDSSQWSRLFVFTTRAKQRYDQISYARGDALLFGQETQGLPAAVLEPLSESQRIRLPMRQSSRSLNLSNCVAVAVYEAWRQCDFFTGQ